MADLFSLDTYGRRALRRQLAPIFMMSGHFYQVKAPEKLHPCFKEDGADDFLTKGDLVDFSHLGRQKEIMLGIVLNTLATKRTGKLLTTNQRGWVKAATMGLAYIPDEEVISSREAHRLGVLRIESAPAAF